MRGTGGTPVGIHAFDELGLAPRRLAAIWHPVDLDVQPLKGLLHAQTDLHVEASIDRDGLPKSLRVDQRFAADVPKTSATKDAGAAEPAHLLYGECRVHESLQRRRLSLEVSTVHEHLAEHMASKSLEDADHTIIGLVEGENAGHRNAKKSPTQVMSRLMPMDPFRYIES